MPQTEMNFQDYLRVLRKRWMIIVITPLLFITASLVFQGESSTVYLASTKVKVQQSSKGVGL